MELTGINEFRSEDDGRKDKEDPRITFGESKNENSEMKEEKALVKVPPKSDIKLSTDETKTYFVQNSFDILSYVKVFLISNE